MYFSALKAVDRPDYKVSMPEISMAFEGGADEQLLCYDDTGIPLPAHGCHTVSWQSSFAQRESLRSAPGPRFMNGLPVRKCKIYRHSHLPSILERTSAKISSKFRSACYLASASKARTHERYRQ